MFVIYLYTASPQIYSIALSSQYAGTASTVTLTFTFTPTISIPANGYINIIFDSNLIVGEIVSGSCMIWEIVSSSYVEAQSCFKSNRQISLQIKSEQYTKGSQYRIQLVNLVFSPTSSGIFFSDITFLQADYSTKIHSYSQKIEFLPAVFSFPVMSLYPREQLTMAVLDFQFITPFDIPHSRPQNISTEVVSYIAIGFSPSGPTSLYADLGYSTNFPTFIPCLELKGLTPVEGSHVNCTVMTLDSPTILIKNYQPIKAGTTLRFVISSFFTPNGNFIAKISIVKKFNRIISLVAQHSETFMVTSTLTRKSI